MNSFPVPNTHVKIPTLTKKTTGNLRFSSMEHVKHLVYTEKQTSSSIPLIKPTFSVNSIVKPTFSVNSIVKPNITPSKITVDGKIVDIDVLTKLQQQSGGNIVSFTASKEFLSSLASAKVNVSRTILPPDKKKQDASSVFKSGSVAVAPPNLSRKISQAKILLPKTHLNGYKSNIEVKKFAPEMKGLLSGLSTALKSAPIITTNINTHHSNKAIKTQNSSQQIKTRTNNLPQSKGNLLLSVKTTTIHAKSLPTKATKTTTNCIGNKDTNKSQSSIGTSLMKLSEVSLKHSSPDVTKTTSIVTDKVYSFQNNNSLYAYLRNSKNNSLLTRCINTKTSESDYFGPGKKTHIQEKTTEEGKACLKGYSSFKIQKMLEGFQRDNVSNKIQSDCVFKNRMAPRNDISDVKFPPNEERRNIKKEEETKIEACDQKKISGYVS